MELQYTDFISAISTFKLQTKYVELTNKYLLYAQDSNFIITSTVFKSSDEGDDFEATHKATFNKTLGYVTTEAFSAKKLPDGKSIYTRATGVSYSLSVGTNDCYFSIPFPAVKIDGIEIIGGEIGDKVDLWVLDTPTGTISTISNYPLNQFGFGVGIAKDFYRRESKYDADLIQDMQIWADYDSVSAKDVTINYLIHEVK
jgi:hypothetical protein